MKKPAALILAAAALALPPGACAGLAEDAGNNYILAKAAPGKPVRYYAGACWDRDGTSRFPDKAAWETHLADLALRLKHPLTVTYSPAAK